MRFVSSVVVLSALRASALEVVISPTQQYVACSQVSVGGNGLVLTVFPLPLGAVAPLDCDAVPPKSLEILKCGRIEDVAKYEKEYNQMKLLAATSSWAPVVGESFIRREGHPCIVMERFAIDIGKLRNGYGKARWPWATLGSLGARMIEIVQELHSKFTIVHSDLHAGNWMLPEPFSPNLKLIDFGDSKPVPHAKAAAEEVKEILATIRYLYENDHTFYVWKRYPFNSGEACANVPPALCDALVYVNEMKDSEPIDYQRLHKDMTGLMELEGYSYKGRVEWGPLKTALGEPLPVNVNNLNKLTESPFNNTPSSRKQKAATDGSPVLPTQQDARSTETHSWVSVPILTVLLIVARLA